MTSAANNFTIYIILIVGIIIHGTAEKTTARDCLVYQIQNGIHHQTPELLLSERSNSLQVETMMPFNNTSCLVIVYLTLQNNSNICVYEKPSGDMVAYIEHNSKKSDPITLIKDKLSPMTRSGSWLRLQFTFHQNIIIVNRLGSVIPFIILHNLTSVPHKVVVSTNCEKHVQVVCNCILKCKNYPIYEKEYENQPTFQTSLPFFLVIYDAIYHNNSTFNGNSLTNKSMLNATITFSWRNNHMIKESIQKRLNGLNFNRGLIIVSDASLFNIMFQESQDGDIEVPEYLLSGVPSTVDADTISITLITSATNIVWTINCLPDWIQETIDGNIVKTNTSLSQSKPTLKDISEVTAGEVVAWTMASLAMIAVLILALTVCCSNRARDNHTSYNNYYSGTHLGSCEQISLPPTKYRKAEENNEPEYPCINYEPGKASS